MQFYFENVGNLGNVAISRHAQNKAKEFGISEQTLLDVLRNGRDTPDGLEIIWREKNGVRLVILLHPRPFSGAKLVKTLYRVRANESSR